jgi:hypothetical protein
MNAFLHPSLSPEMQAALRIGYGILLTLTLAQAIPQARRFFLSERWGGYAKSEPRVDVVQNPYVLPVLLVLWLSCALALVAGRLTVPAALVNLLLCHYFFVAMRWRGILRGMGAPGFMSYWLAACVFFLECGLRLDPTGRLRTAALVAFKLDFAVIMLCAGTYKALAGYPRNDGMELGMINPWWGYWGRFYARIRPGSWVFKTLNHLAYATEIAGGLLMLFPPAQVVGALLIFASFAFIATHIRLGFLCEMVMLCTLLYVPAGHPIDRAVASIARATPSAAPAMPGWLAFALAALLYAYAVLLPFAKAGQYWNFLARRPLPGVLQAVLERYTNFFGIIIWRVFSVDVTNFFAEITVRDAAGNEIAPARWKRFAWARLRYLHVGEFICLASLFTTLKYYARDRPLFVERLLRYARTVPGPAGGRVVFRYVAVRKDEGRFAFAPVAEFTCDREAGMVEETSLDPSFSVRAASPVSPVHEGFKPGSYAPSPDAARS